MIICQFNFYLNNVNYSNITSKRHFCIITLSLLLFWGINIARSMWQVHKLSHFYGQIAFNQNKLPSSYCNRKKVCQAEYLWSCMLSLFFHSHMQLSSNFIEALNMSILWTCYISHLLHWQVACQKLIILRDKTRKLYVFHSSFIIFISSIIIITDFAV